MPGRPLPGVVVIAANDATAVEQRDREVAAPRGHLPLAGDGAGHIGLHTPGVSAHPADRLHRDRKRPRARHGHGCQAAAALISPSSSQAPWLSPGFSHNNAQQSVTARSCSPRHQALIGRPCRQRKTAGYRPTPSRARRRSPPVASARPGAPRSRNARAPPHHRRLRRQARRGERARPGSASHSTRPSSSRVARARSPRSRSASARRTGSSASRSRRREAAARTQTAGVGRRRSPARAVPRSCPRARPSTARLDPTARARASCSGAPVSATGARGPISPRGYCQRPASDTPRKLTGHSSPAHDPAARGKGVPAGPRRAQLPHHGRGNAARHANDRVRRARRADRPRREPGPRAERPRQPDSRAYRGFLYQSSPDPVFRTNSLPTP